MSSTLHVVSHAVLYGGSASAVDLFGPGAAVNSVLFDPGNAWHSVQPRKWWCLCRLSTKWEISYDNLHILPQRPFSTLHSSLCMYQMQCDHNHDGQCEKDFSVRNISHRFIQPGQNVSLPNSSTLTLTLNAQQNAAVLFGKRRWGGSCKFAMMNSKTTAVNIFLNIQLKQALRISTFEETLHLNDDGCHGVFVSNEEFFFITTHSKSKAYEQSDYWHKWTMWLFLFCRPLLWLCRLDSRDFFSRSPRSELRRRTLIINHNIPPSFHAPTPASSHTGSTLAPHRPLITIFNFVNWKVNWWHWQHEWWQMVIKGGNH